MTDYRAIAQAALRSSDAVLRRWLPGGTRRGHEYLACNPTRLDERPGSFSVNMDTGQWADFATGDKGGDLVSLVAYLDGTKQGPAADALAGFLGLQVSSAESFGTHPEAVRQDAGRTQGPNTARPSEDAWLALLPIPEDAPPPPARHVKLGTPSATWKYLDPEGQTLCLVLRFEQAEGDKEFRPLTYCEGAGGKRAWRWQGPPDPRPPYGRDRLAAHPAATVIVCEGEKAADAAAALLPAPDFVAVTSLNGAQSPGKSDWLPLAGRRVVLWPDNDEPGQKYAQQVGRLASEAGAAEVAILDPAELLPDAPEGWDAADALAEGLAPVHLRQWVDRIASREDADESASTEAPEMDPATKAPKRKTGGSPYQLIQWKEGFRNGVYFFGKDAKGEPQPPQLICSPLEIVARTRNTINGNWGYLLEWDDPDGHLHQWAMPAELLSGDGSEYRSELLHGGLYIAPGSKAKNHLTSYVQGTYTEARARCTDRTGWHGCAFVLPDRVIGSQGDERVIFQSAAGSANYYSTAGTVDEWRREVAALAIGNTRLLFAISTAFASVLLELTGDENGGFHMQGPSSEGKSSALYAGASVFGGRDYLHRWRATSNGLEGIATAHSGALLILDELGQVDPREAGEIAYMLANGSGKHRANRTGGARRNQSWRLLFLSSGEIDLAQHMLSIGKRARAGQEARLLSFAANPGKGLGIYDHLGDFPDGAALSRALDERTRRYHGTAGVAFIQAVAGDLARLPDSIRKATKAFVDANLPANASGQAHRAAARFALVAAGGELATRYGVTGWRSGEASQAAASCFRAWLEGRGGAGDQETQAILAQVLKFFENHGESRFRDWDNTCPACGGKGMRGSIGGNLYECARCKGSGTEERAIRDRAGVRRLEDGEWTYYVLTETFGQDVCCGYVQKHVISVLDKAGILIRAKDGRPSINDRLPGIGQQRSYRLRPFANRAVT
jgi:putative DNA primase/helicase